MREAVGGTWLFQIVIFFVLLFSGYLALSMNMSKAFKAKNEVVDIIERKKGVYTLPDGTGSLEEIIKYFNRVGYRTTGTCNRTTEYINEAGAKTTTTTEWYGLNNNGKLETPQNNKKYYMCILYKRLPASDPTFKGELPESGYFKIRLFFHMDLPIFGSIFNMQITGETAQMYYAQWGNK